MTRPEVAHSLADNRCAFAMEGQAMRTHDQGSLCRSEVEEYLSQLRHVKILA